jgi:hypothetical protein
VSGITKVLSKDFHPVYSINLSTDTKMVVILNLVGVLITGITLGLAWIFTSLVRKNFSTDPIFSKEIKFNPLEGLFWLLAIVIITLVVHELIHAFFFWLFTRSRPTFGLGLSYAFAAAPEWYIPRHLYLMVGLAPLALIALGGLLVLGWGPSAWMLPAMTILAFNSGAAVGDIWINARLLLGCSKETLVQDTGHKITFFEPRRVIN